MDDDLPVRRDLLIPAGELSWTASRSGGPGGQAVNKLSTRITLRWNVSTSAALTDIQRGRLLERLGSRLTKTGELVIHCDENRSQLDNRREARRRLAEVVDEALKVARKRRPTRPTKGSKRRRVDAKTQHGQTKRLRGRPPRDD